MRQPGCDRSSDVRSLSRRGFGRSRFHVRVSDTGDSRIDDHLSELRYGKGRDHANGRLPVLLWMQRLRLAVASEARRLLRVLFLRVGFLPADSTTARVLQLITARNGKSKNRSILITAARRFP